jgi:hypothetical protein
MPKLPKIEESAKVPKKPIYSVLNGEVKESAFSANHFF